MTVAAAAPIQPLAWELPDVMGVALKRKKKKNGGHRKVFVPTSPRGHQLGYIISPLSDTFLGQEDNTHT